MLVELVCIFGLVLSIILFIRERDLKYPLFFAISFLFTMTIEPVGVADNVWTWGEIMMPFGYLFLGVPVAVYLIYASASSLVIFVTKLIIKVRKKNKKIDKTVAHISILIGIFFVFMVSVGVHSYIGYTFVLFGLYLLVKDPTMFYIGTILLVADLIIEYMFILNGQLGYAISYGDVGVGFFLGGSIISALVILMERKYSKQKKKI